MATKPRENNKAVMKVSGYFPYFYIEIPSTAGYLFSGMREMDLFASHLEETYISSSSTPTALA